MTRFFTFRGITITAIKYLILGGTNRKVASKINLISLKNLWVDY